MGLVGAPLKRPKTRFGHSLISLGLRFSPPTRAGQGEMKLEFPDEKALKWVEIIDKAVYLGIISHSILESLKGKLGFAQNAIYITGLPVHKCIRCMPSCTVTHITIICTDLRSVP